MNTWQKTDYRFREGDGLLDTLALTLDDQSVAVVNALCALGITFETATLIVSAGRETMLATFEAINDARDRSATRTAAMLVRKGLANDG